MECGVNEGAVRLGIYTLASSLIWKNQENWRQFHKKRANANSIYSGVKRSFTIHYSLCKPNGERKKPRRRRDTGEMITLRPSSLGFRRRIWHLAASEKNGRLPDFTGPEPSVTLDKVFENYYHLLIIHFS